MSKRKGWSVTVTVNGRDCGNWRQVEAVEPWTAIYQVLRYGTGINGTDPVGRSLADVEGMTITVKPDPIPPRVQA